VLLPITGNNAADGGRMLKAHELAARQINEAGGIKSLGGAKVELVVADIQSKPEISGAWASATTIPAMQISDRNGVPFIVTSAVTDSI
ncbi:ABC transporter substrate-binding protein, partial [Acinetobacter baumannii]